MFRPRTQVYQWFPPKYYYQTEIVYTVLSLTSKLLLGAFFSQDPCTSPSMVATDSHTRDTTGSLLLANVLMLDRASDGAAG